MNAKNKVINAYLSSRKTEMYFNEIKDLAKLSNSSLQNALKNMVLNNLISTKKTKAHVFYKIQNTKYFAIQFSDISRQRFEALKRDIKGPLTHLLKELNEDTYSTILFGSASKGQERKGSDIDVLIITPKRKDYDAIKRRINALSKYPITIFQCTPEEFKLEEDHVIKQVKLTGTPIQGEQYFHENNFFE